MFPSIQVQFTDLCHQNPSQQDMSYPQGSQSSTSIEDITPNINFDFEENSPFQEGIMTETRFRDQTSNFFKNQES